jgi:hypothetical protein
MYWRKERRDNFLQHLACPSHETEHFHDTVFTIRRGGLLVKSNICQEIKKLKTLSTGTLTLPCYILAYTEQNDSYCNAFGFIFERHSVRT